MLKNIIICLVLILAAYYGGYINGKSEVPPQTIQKDEAKKENRTIVRKFSKEGVIQKEEVKEGINTVSHEDIQIFPKPDNVILQASKSSVGISIRPLEHLWIGLDYELKNHEPLLKLGYSFRVF